MSAGGVRRFKPRYVGRDAVWLRLLETLARATSGEGHLVQVVGGIGVGKSRLRHELRERLRAEGIPYLEAGRSEVTYQHTLGAFAELVRARELPGPLDEADERLLTRMYAGAPVALTSELRSGGRLDALLARLLLPGRTDPVRVLMVDNFHYADARTREIFEAFARAVVGLPALLVLFQRPDVPCLPVRAGVETHELGPLDADDARRLLEDVVEAGSIPAPLFGEVMGITGGNPLHLLEVLEAWRESGVLLPSGARWRFEAGAHAEEVPRSLESVARRRLRHLPRAYRHPFRSLAVAGPETPREVRARLGVRAEDVEALERFQLLRVGADGRSSPHATVARVAVAGLHPEERRELHAAAAAAWETTGTDAPRVAEHWLAAGERERALPALLEIAGHQRALFDHAGAARSLRDALGILRACGRADEGPALEEQLGDTLLLAGDYPGAETAFRACLGERDDPAAAARRLRKLATALQKAGRYSDSLALCDDALARLGEGHPVLAAALDATAALTLCYDGSIDDAGLRAARGLARLPDDADADPVAAPVVADLCRAAGNVLLAQGQAVLAAAEYQRGMRACELGGDRWELSIALFNVGDAWIVAGRHTLARHFLERARAAKEDIGDRWGLAYTWRALALLELEHGRAPAASAAARRALEIALAVADPKIVSAARCVLARAESATGDREGARRVFLEAWTTAQEVGAVPEMIDALLGLGELELGAGRIEGALGFAVEAESLSRSARVDHLLTAALLGAGRALVACRSFAEARRRYGEALGVTRRTGNHWVREEILRALDAVDREERT